MQWFIQILRDEEAATAVEYAVMLAMILLALFGAVGMVGAQSGAMWGGIDGDLQDIGFGNASGGDPLPPRETR